jgi:hypothetical protein
MSDPFDPILGARRGEPRPAPRRAPRSAAHPAADAVPDRTPSDLEQLRLLGDDIKRFGAGPVTASRLARSRGLDVACSWFDGAWSEMPSLLVSENAHLRGVLLARLLEDDDDPDYFDINAVTDVLVFALATVVPVG